MECSACHVKFPYGLNMKNNKLICLDLYELQALETISSTKQSNLHVAGHFKQLIQVLP